MFSCTKKDKKSPTKQQPLISLLAMDKDEPGSFPLTLHWTLVTEVLQEEEIKRLPQAPAPPSSMYPITWLPLGRKCHMQRYLYVLLYTAINPKQLLCIISCAQFRCDLHPCHSSRQHFCTVFFYENIMQIFNHWLSRFLPWGVFFG